MAYVCWRCRYRLRSSDWAHHNNIDCPKCGRTMRYVYVNVPASRDDHKMWKLAEEKAEPRPTRRRRARAWRAVKAARRNRRRRVDIRRMS